MTDSDIEQVLWHIVQEVAVLDPMADDGWGGSSCFYCGIDDIGKEVIHEPTCIYLKARALVTDKRERLGGTKEYTDEQTGVQLLVEYDVPEYPKLTVSYPDNLSLIEINRAMSRLFNIAGMSQRQRYVWTPLGE